MVAGTAPCIGPVQKPAGSGTTGSAAVPRSRTSSSPRRFNARSARMLGDLEAVVEFQILAVAHIDLHDALVLRHEIEADDRIGGERDVAVEMDDQLAVVGHVGALDEMRRGVLPGHLIHLHAAEIGMADHELSLYRLAQGKITEQPELHAADIL